MRATPLLLAAAFAVPAKAADAPAPIPASEAAARMTLPPGFKATLFAGEPDVVQPIAMTFDDRGRLWVVECMSYPDWARDGKGRDRVLIFEDVDGDGRFDKRTVFLDNGSNLTGVAIGFGGVWLCSAPNLLFVPVNPGEDRPAGPPIVKLDGWSLDAKHNVFNGLTWAPDGWLWGCNGITDTSKVGKPGTPEKDRVRMNCGVWRYHPTRDRFEVVAWGTTNPWGVDFDDVGEAFITNCVIDHLWHVIPGAHYQRMFGQDLNPHVYHLMGPCSDHRHWAGGHWSGARGGPAHHDAGGGHAHCGTMVYLGDNWPDKYRNGVFTCNIHGNRINHDRLTRKGASYVATHEPDFLFANDSWFRGTCLCYGPDGGVYVADWCETGECHNYKEIDRSTGRIYKVTYGDPKPWRGDLSKLSDAELVKLLDHRNEWFVRKAQRNLQERAAAGKPKRAMDNMIGAIVTDEKARPGLRLRALWALHSVGWSPDLIRTVAISDADEHMRSWAMRLHLEQYRDDSAAIDLIHHVFTQYETGLTPKAILALASASQQVAPQKRWPLIGALHQATHLPSDPRYPEILWYAIEPTVAAFPDRSTFWLDSNFPPLVHESIARRLSSLSDDGLTTLVDWLKRSRDAVRQADVLRGIRAAFADRRDVPMPVGWPAAYAKLAISPSPEVREHALQLAVLFGDETAVASVRKTVTDATAPAAQRTAGLALLVQRKVSGLLPLLRVLVADTSLRGTAIRGLAAFDDAGTPALILQHYSSLTDAERADAVATLSSRPTYALALLDAVGKGTVPRRDLSAFTARQMLALKNKEVSDRVARVWGPIRAPAKDRTAAIGRYKQQLTPDVLAAADLPRGRRLFEQNCATCHKMFGEGATIGPELTGSQRANLDYILENIVDPSAIVPNEYRATELELRSGRLVTGLVVAETANAVTLQTPTERVVVPVAEIARREQSPVSMMPDGILDRLSATEVRDLIGYLGSSTQVNK